MLRALFTAVLCIFLLSNRSYAQYANLGSGSLKNYIWWFDWNNFVVANGASRTFVTADGLTVTLTFSNVQGPAFVPNVMNTWYGSVLHFLYDFSDPAIQPALYSIYTTQNTQFTVTVTATRDGVPTGFRFIAADAEASAVNEVTTLTTSGSNWLCLDFFRNSSQSSNPFNGCNTNTAVISDTYAGAAGLGQNPVIYTNAGSSGSLTVNCQFNRNNVEGKMGIAFGIFSPIDRGDLPPSFGFAHHQKNFANNNPCNYNPPLPNLVETQQLKLGNVPGDADSGESLNDNASGVDEDAIAGFPVYSNSGSYSLPVVLNNTTGAAAYLSGWMDINRNGAFENSERVMVTIPDNATGATVTWTGLPAVLPPGPLSRWAFRFRLSGNMASVQTATGFAPDGEVEDYYVNSLQTTTAGFTMVDTVCVNTPITLANTSVNASNYYWNFCSGSLNTIPAGSNFTSPSLSSPVFTELVQDGTNKYAFVVNHTGTLARMDFGNSFLNNPSTVNLGSLGVIPSQAQGLSIKKEGDFWIGYLIGGQNANSRLVRLDFGTSLTSPPVATSLGNIGNLAFPTDFTLMEDASSWYGFTVNADNNTITRYSFGNSLFNNPVATNLGNIGSLDYPVGFYMIRDGTNYHLFVVNRNSNSLSRLDFGASLGNMPTGINLGNPANQMNKPRDITLLRDCGGLYGFVTNEGNNSAVRFNFSTITAVPVASPLGNPANFSFPHSISSIFRAGDAVHFFTPNVTGNSISRLSFTNCSEASIPSYTGATPPSFYYTDPGIYNVSLFVDEGYSSQAVVCRQVVVRGKANVDFTFQQNVCDPQSVVFQPVNAGVTLTNPYWSFGDGNVLTGTYGTTHTYLSPGTYTVKYTVFDANNTCPDTVVKTVSVSLTAQNIIRTIDTTICLGTTKQLITEPAINFCWSPSAYLDHPLSPRPVTSTPATTDYYLMAEVAGNNLVTNGDFSAGNNGFLSQEVVTSSNTGPGEYYIGNSPAAWNAGFSNCGDHTSGSGNMMMVNAYPYSRVWSQTVNVTPNTNYLFSVWVQQLTSVNYTRLMLAADGKRIGPNVFGDFCNWVKYTGYWNSGNQATVTLSIEDLSNSNDAKFALDDISFTPVYMQRDSVHIAVDTAEIRTIDDVSVCAGIPVSLSSSGAATYSWTPASGLDNPSIANPVATPANTTQYVVTGTTAFGCIEDDTVTITILPSPQVTITPSDTICRNSTLQLNATGGGSYTWSPASTLSDGTIANPVASPLADTWYYVTVMNAQGCAKQDSVKVSLYPNPVFHISAGKAVCYGDTLTLHASGGGVYAWAPDQSLSSLTLAHPLVTAHQTTTYSVLITENTCHNSALLETTITVNPLPDVHATKSNDLDCSVGSSDLFATGANIYAWSPSAGLTNPSIANPVASPLATTTYIVKGTSTAGCINFDTIVVKFDGSGAGGYYMPAAFTPNNDGLNDCYGVKYWGLIQEIEFSVFDRWGQRLFFSKDPAACWDGRFMGKAQDIGVYVYMVKARTLCGEVFRKGLFTLAK